MVLAVDDFPVLREAETAISPIAISNIVEREPGLANVSSPSVMGEISLFECLNVVSCWSGLKKAC